MSEAVVGAQAPRRGSTMCAAVQFGVLFLLVGPLVWTLGFAAIEVAEALILGRVENPGALIESLAFNLPFLMLVGYLIGGVPAFVTGLLVGSLDRRIRGWPIYPAVLLVVAGPSVAIGWLGADRDLWSWVAALGALAMLACTALARHAGLGRT